MRQEGARGQCRREATSRLPSGWGATAAENPVGRGFSAGKRDMKRPAGITEVKASDGKVHASPVIDCRDGRIVSCVTGLNSNARLASTMLGQAIVTLPGSTASIVYSDRGRRYSRPGWIRLCGRAWHHPIHEQEGQFPGQSGRRGIPRLHEDRSRLPRTPGTVHMPPGHGPRRHVHALVQLPAHQAIPGMEQFHTPQNGTRAGGLNHLQENTRSPLPLRPFGSRPNPNHAVFFRSDTCFLKRQASSRQQLVCLYSSLDSPYG
jgi:hypothetical protein